MKFTTPHQPSSFVVRMGYSIAAAVAALALASHASTWVRVGAVSWGPALSMGGLLVLMATGAFDVPRGPFRAILSTIGVLGIACGALILLANY